MKDFGMVVYEKSNIDYPVLEMKKTGENIRRLCKKKGITVRAIQDYMGFACPQTVYRWFSGTALPSVDNLYALSRLLEIPMDEILIESCTERTVLYVLQFVRRISKSPFLLYSKLMSNSH